MEGLKVIFQNISGGLVMAGKTHGEMVFSRVSLKEYIAWFKAQEPALLSLSEVHMEQREGSEDNSEMVQKIASELELPYHKCCFQSSSHLDTSKNMGIAVLSKYPIEDYSTFLLPNPRLTTVRPDGSRWVMFDKGAQRLTLNIDGKPLTVFNLHYFPFHHFHRRLDEDAFLNVRHALADILLSEHTTPTIITGDFNNKGLPLREAFPELFFHNRFRQAVEVETTVVGLHNEQFDHILYTPETLTVVRRFAEPNYSDHYAVVAEFVFRC